MNENYIYPAKLTIDSGIFRIEFLDFPDMCVIEEETQDDAIRSAQNYLALAIMDLETRGKKLPIPTMNATNAIFVHIWMPYFRNGTKVKYVKKNVTIPEWLDIMAKENNVSFSVALTNGIKQQLGIKY